MASRGCDAASLIVQSHVASSADALQVCRLRRRLQLQQGSGFHRIMQMKPHQTRHTSALQTKYMWLQKTHMLHTCIACLAPS